MSKRRLGLLLLGVWIGTGGVAHAAITPTPDPLDFGSVVVSQNTTLTETLSANTDTNNVSVAVHGTCPDFSIVSPTGTFNIPHNSSQDVVVKFAPMSPGNKTCMIDIKVGGSVMRSFNTMGKGIAPKITVTTPTFPATDVSQTSDPQLLTLTNSGDSDLTITSATVKSGSADFTVTGTPTVPLAPNGQTSWNVTCHPSTFSTRTGTFEIVSDAFGANTLDITLTCVGNEGVLATDQPAAIAFTAVPRNTPQPRTFTLTNTGNVAVSNVNLAINPPNAGYSLDTTALTTLAAGGNKTITITFKPQSKTDGGMATITFTGTYGASASPTPALSLDIAGGIESSYGLSPAQPALDFGKFRYDAHPQQTFQVLNDGAATLMMNTPFTPDTGTTAIEYKVELANGTMTVTQPARLVADDHVTVLVSPQVDHRIGVVSGHIDITPDFGAPLHVPITGIATAAEVDVPATVSFGVVSLEEPPAMKTVTLTNTGSGTLDITSFTQDAPGAPGPNPVFTITLPNMPRHLNPGEALDIPVVYQPTVATADSAPDMVILTVQLGGSLNGSATTQITGGAVFFQAHGSGGCDAGGAGRGGGLVIGLAALVVLRRRRRLAAAAIAVAAGTAALAPAARADGIGLSVFAPTPATAGEGFALQAPEIGASGSWVTSAVVSYASNPLVLDSLSAGGGRESVALVERSTLMQVGAAVALFGRLELGAHLPIYQQSGESGQVGRGLMLNRVKGTATGNLALHLKARLVRVDTGPGRFAVGASAIATIPTATKDQFTGADHPEGRLLVLASFTPAALESRLTISVNAGPVIRKESRLTISVNTGPMTGNASRNADIVQKSGAAWGGGASVRILDELWATAELFGEATPSARQLQPTGGAMPPPATLSAIEGLAGLTIKPDRRVSIGMAVGRGLTDAIGTPDLRGVVSVSIVPGAATLVPIHPVLPDGDADGDGIPDSVDKCPHEPEDKDGFEDQDGCPDPDNDHDGIPDAQDKCPLDPEDRDGFQDEDGCPDPDNDRDGIPDSVDKCPNEPEDKDGFEDLDGCPDPDNDHDGILDEKDRCPTEPETINGFQDDDGCPDKGDSTIILSPDKIETLDPIQFTGVKLARSATPLIEQVGATLRAHPEILRVRVTVHVQPTGDSDADQARTDKRAQAARDWLVQWGVAPARLEVRGFGGTKPLVPPDQRGAARLNERIEFIILERK